MKTSTKLLILITLLTMFFSSCATSDLFVSDAHSYKEVVWCNYDTVWVKTVKQTLQGHVVDTIPLPNYNHIPMFNGDLIQLRWEYRGRL